MALPGEPVGFHAHETRGQSSTQWVETLEGATLEETNSLAREWLFLFLPFTRTSGFDVPKQHTILVLATSEQGKGASQPVVRLMGTDLKIHGHLENGRAPRAFPHQLGLLYHPRAQRRGHIHHSHPSTEFPDFGPDSCCTLFLQREVDPPVHMAYASLWPQASPTRFWSLSLVCFLSASEQHWSLV